MLTPYDMAEKVADYLELDKKYFEKVDASSFRQPAQRPAKTGFVIEKAEKELGFVPHSFEDGLKIVVEQIKGK